MYIAECGNTRDVTQHPPANVECHGKKRIISIVSAARECHERRTNGNLNHDAMYTWRKIYKSTFRGCFQRAIRGTFRCGARDSDAVH